MTNACLQTAELRGYLNGRTPEAMLDSLEDHFRACPTCSQNLEALADMEWAEPDSVDHILKQLCKASLHQAGEANGWQVALNSVNHFQQSLNESSQHLGEQFESDSPPDMLRDYRLLECIGKGGMGRVYRALHVRLNQPRAVKLLKSDRLNSAESIARFEREMKLVAQLKHPHIVEAMDAGEHNGLPYFVMEFVSGINLAQLVQRMGKLSVPEACQIVRQAASALHFAHDQKVIHRDVKPSNLMLNAAGIVKLLDLGFSSVLRFPI